MMQLNSIEKEAFFQLLSDRGFRYLKRGWFHFNRSKTTSLKTFSKELGFPDSLGDYPELKDILISALRGSVQIADFYPAIEEYSKEAVEESYPKIELPGVNPSDVYNYIKSLTPMMNLDRSDRHSTVLIDVKDNYRPVLNIEPEHYFLISGNSYAQMMADPTSLRGFIEFNPYSLESVSVKNTKGIGCVIYVNLYIAPAWRFVEAQARFGGFIKKLMTHLFPNKDELEYVLDWLHYAIVKRNETVLCLIGPRGTGKGILLKDILGALIGEEYREIVNQEILTDKFNAAFKNRRYIFFDEVNVSGDRELNKFKAFCNSHIALEEKGRDSETIDNYTSLALSSNDKRDFRAEPQERRFSVPEVTEVPLLKVVPEEEIEAFINRISDPKSVEIAEFGQFLLARTPKNSSRTPLKTRYYFQLCKLSMPEWKMFIIEFLINEGVKGEYILNSHLAKKFKKLHGENAPYATKRGSIETFLMDYYHEGVCRIGKIVDAWDSGRARDTFAILPSDEFLDLFGKNYSQENPIDSL